MAHKQSICVSAFSKRDKLRLSHWFPFLKIKDNLKIKFKSHQRAYIKIPTERFTFTIGWYPNVIVYKNHILKALCIKIVNQFSGSHTINKSSPGQAMGLGLGRRQECPPSV